MTIAVEKFLDNYIMDNSADSKIIFENIINDSRVYLYTLSYRLCSSSEDAKDLLQDTYLRAWGNWSNLKNKENPVPWLRKICINIFIDSMRKKKSKQKLITVEFPADFHEFAAETPTPEDELLASEEIHKIQSQCYSIVSTFLPLYQRVTFVLTDILKLKIQDTASLIDRTVPATKSLLHRARKKMNSFMGSKCSLIHSENFCKCESWITFSQNLQQRQDYFKAILESDNKTDTSKTKEKVLSYFKNLPFLTHPYDSV